MPPIRTFFGRSYPDTWYIYIYIYIFFKDQVLCKLRSGFSFRAPLRTATVASGFACDFFAVANSFLQ